MDQSFAAPFFMFCSVRIVADTRRCGYYLLTDSWWLMLGSLCAWEDTRGVDRTDTDRIFLVKAMYTGLGNLRYLLVS
jgi:hypothetical protein